MSVAQYNVHVSMHNCTCAFTMLECPMSVSMYGSLHGQGWEGTCRQAGFP